VPGTLRKEDEKNTSHALFAVVMIRYQDFNFDTISIRYFKNIAMVPTVRKSQKKSKFQSAKVNKDAEKI